jgi:hypothetical protein
MNAKESPARLLCEAIDGFILPKGVREQFFQERTRFRNHSTRRPVSQVRALLRELELSPSFEPAANQCARPTIGQDAELSYYDPNPKERWNPNHREGKTINTSGKTLLEAKKRAEDSMAGVEQALPQQQMQAYQQAQDVAQQGVATGQMSPQDAMQGGVMPELPSLPRDFRKDPSSLANQPVPVAAGVLTVDQHIMSRYNKQIDPLRQLGPRTFSYATRMRQANWGARRSSRLLNNQE